MSVNRLTEGNVLLDFLSISGNDISLGCVTIDGGGSLRTLDEFESVDFKICDLDTFLSRKKNP